MVRSFASLLLISLLVPVCAAAPKRVKPKPGTDEFAIESTVLAVCNVISGPAGRRDWNRFKELFAPGAHLASYGKDGGAAVMTPDEYIAKAKPYFEEHGFFEWPVETSVERFHDIAHVSSRYESRHATTDAQPFARGVNHFELARSGDRWVVVSLVWQEE
jgi:hypothetical protein